MPLNSKKATVEEILKIKNLPPHDFIFSLCDIVSSVLEQEDEDYRPLDEEGNAGSLIELKEKLPVIVIPDIHGRPDFLLNILNFTLSEKYGFNKPMTVLQALKKGKVYLIGVGDAVHTELTKARWISILEQSDAGNIQSEEMKAEMTADLAVLCAIMKLKIEFTRHFHFLKGNHENVLNATGDGDFSFVKYSDEGELCRKFIENFYGDDILYLIQYYEKSLPLVAFSRAANCVISHAEPAEFYFKSDIINGHLIPEVVAGLTWTCNGDVEENTALFLMKNLLNPEKAGDGVYLAGHRPVKKNYALRQDGKFVQIHNPYLQNVAIAVPGQNFNPDENIVCVN